LKEEIKTLQAELNEAREDVSKLTSQADKLNQDL